MRDVLADPIIAFHKKLIEYLHIIRVTYSFIFYQRDFPVNNIISINAVNFLLADMLRW